MNSRYTLKRIRSGLHPLHEHGVCDNCQTYLVGEVCHKCGQPEQDFHRPILKLVRDGLSDAFALDGRVVRTIPSLMLRPGAMTRLYLKGARARFVPPFRLYIIASLLFFLLVPLMGRLDQGWGNFGPRVQRSQSEAMAPAPWEPDGQPLGRHATQTTVQGFGISVQPEGEGAPAEPLTTEEAVQHMRESLDEQRQRGEITPDVQLYEDNIWAYLTYKLESVSNNQNAVFRETLHWSSRLAFISVPLFAFILAFLYCWRKGLYYFDHLITALHIQSAFFVMALVGALISIIIPIWIVVLFFMTYAWYYIYRVQRTVYTSGRFMGNVRTFVLYMSYMLVFSAGLLIAFVFGVMTV